ncbi:MAG: sulfatase [Verrucomicrobiae bacterium]|nr:sulfatase [Verrucomicrobiae bacterium]
MNLLYLHAHDLGRWIAPYGHAVETPALSDLANRPGTCLFRNAHSAAPTCSPSRAALLTGMTPHESGMLGLMHRGFRLTDPDHHLAVFLKNRGFETALAGIQHLQPGADLRGYDHRFNPVKSLTQQGQVDWKVWDAAVAEAAAGFLENRDDERPFFLDCGFWLPHRPFPEPDSDIEPDRVQPPPGIADTPAHREDMAAFLTAVRHLDRCCGEVLDALDRAGVADETLIVFTTDHGPAFPGYKCRLTGRGTGVSLVIRPPRTATNQFPETSDALVSQLDLFPTICDYLETPAPDWPLRGESLRPLIDGKTREGREAVFGEVTYHAGYEPMRSIRTATHSLIRLFDNDLRPVPANVDDSPAKDTWIEAGGRERPREAWQLFDLRLDPLETRNVADDPAYAGVRVDLEDRLERWMRETKDPLLDGPVALPEGGYANAREHLSATIGEPWTE